MRLGEDRELDALYRALPETLRGLPTWSHYFLTAYPEFESAVGRKADRRRKTLQRTHRVHVLPVSTDQGG